ncbi:hypothetical protein LTR08_002445 [Meristemomyces frigidus]|nr:hypothetical protein LTR08_002445 [Meristemomyces frigidus]
MAHTHCNHQTNKPSNSTTIVHYVPPSCFTRSDTYGPESTFTDSAVNDHVTLDGKASRPAQPGALTAVMCLFGVERNAKAANPEQALEIASLRELAMRLKRDLDQAKRDYTYVQKAMQVSKSQNSAFAWEMSQLINKNKGTKEELSAALRDTANVQETVTIMASAVVELEQTVSRLQLQAQHSVAIPVLNAGSSTAAVIDPTKSSQGSSKQTIKSKSKKPKAKRQQGAQTPVPNGTNASYMPPKTNKVQVSKKTQTPDKASKRAQAPNKAQAAKRLPNPSKAQVPTMFKTNAGRDRSKQNCSKIEGENGEVRDDQAGHGQVKSRGAKVGMAVMEHGGAGGRGDMRIAGTRGGYGGRGGWRGRGGYRGRGGKHG